MTKGRMMSNETMSRHEMGAMMTRAINRANAADDKVEAVQVFCDEQLLLISKYEKNDFDKGYEAALSDVLEVLLKVQS